MQTKSFIVELKQGHDMMPNKNVFASIWGEYERVIIESLITSFGLDFIVGDQYGGDIDTIHNVRAMKEDDQLFYKNNKNAFDYQNRGDYNSVEYHKDERYISINRKISESKKNGTLEDSYTGKKVVQNANIDLDHVIAAKEIHDDPGRILAGLKGTDLANSEENLRPTDRSINRSMQQKDIDDYLVKRELETPQRQERIKELKRKKTLSDKECKELNKLEKIDSINPDKMRFENEKTRKTYDAKINKEYYTSSKFISDMAGAASKRGIQMGARQVFGFVFAEIWFTAKREIQNMPSGCAFKDIFSAVGRGVQKGVESAKVKYKDLIEKFFAGFEAGALASISTTICNIFFTTARNLVKVIRQIYAAVVQAGKVLLFNPDNLPLGQRIREAMVIMATGASVLIGTTVGELIEMNPISKIPVVGDLVQVFCSTLVSGLISCSFLIFLDRSEMMNQVISFLNKIPSEANNYAVMADAFERLTAKLANLDIAAFETETKKYSSMARQICECENEDEINDLLLSAYKTFDIIIPWRGDFDSFMGKKTNKLVFE